MAFSFSNNWGTATSFPVPQNIPSDYVQVSGSSWGLPATKVPTSPTKSDAQNLYKTELCRSFEETSFCRYGPKCQFAHGQAELRPISRHPKYKTEVCKTFSSTGSCPYGKRCRFIHSRNESDFQFSNVSPSNSVDNSFSTTWEPFNTSFGSQTKPSEHSKSSFTTSPQTKPQEASKPLSLGLGFVDSKSSETFELVTPFADMTFSPYSFESSSPQPKRLSFFESILTDSR